MAFESGSPESQCRQGHDYYAELCAFFTSGSLSSDEVAELEAHLLHCESCAKLLLSYRAVAKSTVSLLGPGRQVEPARLEKFWSVENAKKHLFNRIEAEPRAHQPRLLPHRDIWSPNRLPIFGRLAAPAAMLLLALLLVGLSYHFGQLRGRRIAQQSPGTNAVEMQDRDRLQAITQQRSDLEERLTAQSREAQRLQQEVQHQAAAIAELKAAEDKLQRSTSEQTAIIAALGSDKAALGAERDAAAHKLQETQEALTTVQQQLNALQAEHSRQLLRAASLQTRVDELSSNLTESAETVQRAEKFLASDRDIRELMGARDLYIADVFDVDREGKPQKAFGRVFYTGGKSLIFYAFDLDRQPGVHEASTFQVWGRRGPGDKRPLNMGILYLDNAANRRWVLRFDDPKILNEIDAVFVTVEPNSGGRKPTGKQLLFASLRTPPNHP